jgi:hypothetical protein
VKHAAALAAALLVLGARADHASQEPTRQTDAGAPPSQSTVPWTIGERLEYQVKFGFFNVGRGTLQGLGVDTMRA